MVSKPIYVQLTHTHKNQRHRLNSGRLQKPYVSQGHLFSRIFFKQTLWFCWLSLYSPDTPKLSKNYGETRFQLPQWSLKPYRSQTLFSTTMNQVLYRHLVIAMIPRMLLQYLTFVPRSIHLFIIICLLSSSVFTV